VDWRDVWRTLFPKRMIASDVQEEIAFHVEERIRELVRRGWTEERARAHVLDSFGDVRSVEEACRAYDAQRVDGQTWRLAVEGWVRDVRFALRSLGRSYGFTTVVIVMLALGIGASAAVFSVVESVLLRPLSFFEPDRLAVVWQNDRATGTVREAASPADYFDYVERSRTFTDLAMHGGGPAVLTRPGSDALQLSTAVVTPNMLAVLGVRPQLGRDFTNEDNVADGSGTVLLTHRVWRDLFGADPAVVGRILTINELPYEVIGVLPDGLDFPARTTDVWMPILETRTAAIRSQHWVTVVGRLSDGATMADAQGEMTQIMTDLEREYPADNVNRGAFVEALSDVGRGDLRLTLWVLLGAVLVVFAIACVNVANLLLAREAARHRELAVLTAVGASRGQLARRFFTEGALLAVAAGLGGVALASVGVKALTSLAPVELLAIAEPRLNAPVLLFALALSTVICVGLGLVPVAQVRRLDLQRALKDGRTTEGASARVGVRRLLVAAQLALAVVLLLGATLLIETVRGLQAVDPGFRAEGTLRLGYTLPHTRYPSMATYPDWPQIQGPIRALEDEVRAIAGVRSVATVLAHSLEAGFTNSFRIEGRPYDPTQGEISTRLVTPGYFETAGVAVIDGRPLRDGDRVGTPDVVLINREAARRYFPDESPIGQRIALFGLAYREVVGIVENERIHGLRADPPPAIYATMYQAPPLGGKITMLVRTDVTPLDLVDDVRSAFRRVEPDVPVFDIATMDETLGQAVARERFASTVLTLFGAIALMLAVLGVHGVLAYLITQRAHEVGIRMALGATRHDVVRLVVRQGASMTALGLAVGLVAAVAAAAALRGLLYGVSPTHPGSYLLVAAVLAAVAMGATALPAWRAASIDPVSSLKGE
jgi:putative ABC transport system permease protein